MRGLRKRRAWRVGTATALGVVVVITAVAGCAGRAKFGGDRPERTLKEAVLYDASAEAASTNPATSKPGKPPDPALVRAYAKFGFDLFTELSREDAGKDVFISPTSVALALAMTYNGAAGDTAKAMAKVLRVEWMSLAEVNDANLALQESLRGADPKVQLSIANSLWADKDVALRQGFINRDKRFFRADLALLDFKGPQSVDVINAWVNRNTKGKIPTIIDSIPQEAFLYLINAIYFNGKWSRPFEKKHTRDEVFTFPDGRTKRLPTMFQSGDYRYYEGEGFQAVGLPYGKGRMSMYVFLPDEDSGLEEFARSLNVANWDKWMNGFAEAQGTVGLPRFKLEYGEELNTALTSLGMGPAFDPRRADFRGMTGPPAWISRVVHKTFVDVDEEGTEAAAVTAVIMAGSLAPPKTFRMIVNRPFFFAIRDNMTGTNLFMGSVSDPQT